ncbi:sugar transferase [Ornithinimicrobium kibberense]
MGRVAGRPFSGASSFYARRGKRICDLGLALILSPFSAVVIGLLAPTIKLKDGGPVFHKATRVGLHGAPFTMFKLRTMQVDAPDLRNPDGSTYSGPNDPRVTHLGNFLRKTSLDELPQVFNVFRGDMSFVGPRPDLIEQAMYYDDLTRKKLTVRPGVTGYNQAYFRNSIPWSERLGNDVFYARNVSVLFDLRILLRTFVSLVTPVGIARVHQTSRGDSNVAT